MFYDPNVPTSMPSPNDAAIDVPAEAPSPASVAQLKFQSCRWYQAAEGQAPAHCTHRDVLPLAGREGFHAEAWCPDCTWFKVRRTARKNFTR